MIQVTTGNSPGYHPNPRESRPAAPAQSTKSRDAKIHELVEMIAHRHASLRSDAEKKKRFEAYLKEWEKIIPFSIDLDGLIDIHKRYKDIPSHRGDLVYEDFELHGKIQAQDGKIVIESANGTIITSSNGVEFLPGPDKKFEMEDALRMALITLKQTSMSPSHGDILIKGTGFRQDEKTGKILNYGDVTERLMLQKALEFIAKEYLPEEDRPKFHKDSYVGGWHPIAGRAAHITDDQMRKMFAHLPEARSFVQAIKIKGNDAFLPEIEPEPENVILDDNDDLDENTVSFDLSDLPDTDTPLDIVGVKTQAPNNVSAEFSEPVTPEAYPTMPDEGNAVEVEVADKLDDALENTEVYQPKAEFLSTTPSILQFYTTAFEPMNEASAEPSSVEPKDVFVKTALQDSSVTTPSLGDEVQEEFSKNNPELNPVLQTKLAWEKAFEEDPSLLVENSKFDGYTFNGKPVFLFTAKYEDSAQTDIYVISDETEFARVIRIDGDGEVYYKDDTVIYSTAEEQAANRHEEQTLKAQEAEVVKTYVVTDDMTEEEMDNLVQASIRETNSLLEPVIDGLAESVVEGNTLKQEAMRDRIKDEAKKQPDWYVEARNMMTAYPKQFKDVKASDLLKAINDIREKFQGFEPLQASNEELIERLKADHLIQTKDYKSGEKITKVATFINRDPVYKEVVKILINNREAFMGKGFAEVEQLVINLRKSDDPEEQTKYSSKMASDIWRDLKSDGIIVLSDGLIREKLDRDGRVERPAAKILDVAAGLKHVDHRLTSAFNVAAMAPVFEQQRPATALDISNDAHDPVANSIALGKKDGVASYALSRAAAANKGNTLNLEKLTRSDTRLRGMEPRSAAE